MKIGTLASVRPAGPRLATGTVRWPTRARPFRHDTRRETAAHRQSPGRQGDGRLRRRVLITPSSHTILVVAEVQS